MFFYLRKIVHTITLNFFLFLLLIIGIQNSSSQKKVNLIITETVRLPISFIVGMSLITGSLTGSFLNLNINNRE